MFTCQCGESFSRKDALSRHQNQCMQKETLNLFFCMFCLCSFSRHDNLRRHYKAKHPREPLPSKKQSSRPLPTPPLLQEAANQARPSEEPPTKRPRLEMRWCCSCQVDVPKTTWSGHIKTLNHKRKNCTPSQIPGVFLVEQAFQSRITIFRILATGIMIDTLEFLGGIYSQVEAVLTNQLEIHGMKVNFELFGEYEQQTTGKREVKSHLTKAIIINSPDQIDEVYQEQKGVLLRKAQEFEEKDSGWTLLRWCWLELRVAKYRSIAGSSYLELPKIIRDKKTVLNIQNNDDLCFKWSVLAALHPIPREQQPHRVSHYTPYERELNFKGIGFPVRLDDIAQFEQLNDISVNVYGLEKIFVDGSMNVEVVGPLYYTASRRARHVNLLIITNDEGVSHYCLIRDMSRLVRSQISKHHGRKYLCDGCLVFFSSEAKLQEHQQYDCNHVRVNLPTTDLKKDKCGKDIPGHIMKFQDFDKQLKVPYVCYADFESCLVPVENKQIPDNSNQSYTIKTHRHIPYSFTYIIKCSYDDSQSKVETYRGPDASKVFMERLENDARRIYTDHLSKVHPISMTPEQERDFQNSTHCHICKQAFQPEDEKVRDHDHLLPTNNYRGASHSICNLNFKIPSFIPIFLHNLSGYDAHLFIKDLAEKGSSVDVIAQNKERYISFSKHLLVGEKEDIKGKLKKVHLKLRFLDSMRFMAMSLDKLSQNLRDDQCVELRKRFPDEKKFKLMRQKGVFPYSFVTSLERLETPGLPPQKCFYDDLRKESVTNECYERAKQVWKVFECKTLGEYSDVYVLSDVLLLCDVFENFRQVCITHYGLDPAQYFTAPGLAWSAALKCTGVELELLTDIEMHAFLKKGIRGGVASCMTRRAKANNPFMPTFDSSAPTSYIMYLDATNLYGAAMSQRLPVGGFEWLDENKIQNFDVNTIPDDSDEGFILEVDIEYPEELHDLHNDLPFLPESIVPPVAKTKISKLCPNLSKKQKYVIHYKNLKQALVNGLILKKIHRVLRFQQTPWLKKYIDLNTDLRNKAKNAFEKAFFKLMNNSVFGKTMENVDKRVDIKLVTHWERIGRKLGAEDYIAKPHYKNCSRFTDDFVAIQMKRTKVIYDKPIYTGFCVLDLSKVIMYEFYYGFIKQKYGDRAVLLYTDTDSLILYVQAENFYDDIKQNLEKYDTSNYIEGNRHGLPVNESVLGRMKDEYEGKIVWEFIGTGAKAYLVDCEGELTKKAKGVKDCVTKKELNKSDYEMVVESQGGSMMDESGAYVAVDGRIFRNMSTFRTYKHEVFTEMRNKVALSYFDDKRCVIPNSYKTLAWGHKDIPSELNE